MLGVHNLPCALVDVQPFTVAQWLDREEAAHGLDHRPAGRRHDRGVQRVMQITVVAHFLQPPRVAQVSGGAAVHCHHGPSRVTIEPECPFHVVGEQPRDVPGVVEVALTELVRRPIAEIPLQQPVPLGARQAHRRNPRFELAPCVGIRSEVLERGLATLALVG